MNTENLFLVLKYTGSIFAGLYGLYATLTSFYVEKDGKRIFSKKGYFGIALLTLSVLLTLLGDFTKDLREIKESKVKLEREYREREERLAREEAVIKNLSAQLGIIQKISNDLKVTENKIAETSETTSEILRENLERVEDFEVKLFISINPFIFSDESGKNIVSKERSDNIAEQLQENYDLVRKKVFKRWELNIQIDHRDKGREKFLHDVWMRHQMEDGLSSFVISHVSDRVNGVPRVQCWLAYRLFPNRAADFRTFKDFNGANFSFALEADPQVLDLTTVRINMGIGGGIKPLFLQQDAFASKTEGLWRGEIQIPINFF